eukprot:XP_001704949.1 Hypothetical protein GL50803_31974 [Giardia lamblia ATCC 50803]
MGRSSGRVAAGSSNFFSCLSIKRALRSLRNARIFCLSSNSLICSSSLSHGVCSFLASKALSFSLLGRNTALRGFSSDLSGCMVGFVTHSLPFLTIQAVDCRVSKLI